VASPLPRECSTTELQGHCCPYIYVQRKLGAGEGNRTLVISLEGFSSTIELHPQGPLTSAAILLSTGGGGWIRTSVLVRGQIYSLLPLTTRPPLLGEPQTIVETPTSCQHPTLFLEKISCKSGDKTDCGTLRRSGVSRLTTHLKARFAGRTLNFTARRNCGDAVYQTCGIELVELGAR
jgi:hypothetical protein